MPKDNPFSDNPFGARQADPFAEQVPSASQSQSNGWGGGGAWGANNGTNTAASTSTGGAFSVPSASEDGYAVPRREDLEAKEKALAAKEAELAKWEENLKASGQLRPAKNWPVCMPILHHDIAGDVPADKQYMVSFAYWSYLGFLICITWNAFASLMALCVIGGGDDRLAGFLLSMVYWFAGVPGAWILWYRRVYNASQNDRAFTYLLFFLFYLLHIVWCIYASISPPFGFSRWALAGYVAGIKAFDKNIFVGVCFVVGAGFWTIEALWALWVLKSVYSNFRGSGGNTRLKQEAASSAVKFGIKSQARKSGGKMPMSGFGEA